MCQVRPIRGGPRRAGRRAARLLASASAAATAIATAARPAAAAPPGSGWDLVFADEFEGTSLDTLKWNYNYSWGRTHNHRAYMRESQVIVGGGLLNLQAIAQRDPSAPSYVDTSDFGRQYLDYTSGAVNTSGKFNFTGGYVEARMKMQDTAGTWPAFWTLQGGWPPEIDVMEFPRGSSNSASQYWANYHYTNASGAHASYGWHDTRANLTTAFHTFAVAWSPTAMTFYFDGAATHTITDAAAIADSANMYMILNHAVGGWAGTPAPNSEFPIDFQVDWVRVWQQRPAGGGTTSTWAVNGGGSWDAPASWTGLVPKYGSQQARFGRAGTAATATVTWDYSRTVGSVVFEGAAGGTTAYTLGDANAALQLANGASADALVQVLSTSQADQTINARLDLYNNTTINNQMTGGHLLVLNGVITGGGDLTVDGPGTVQFSNNNTYTGDTYIDDAAGGPAVARVTRSRPFGTAGTVHVGRNGNSTTARIEVRDNRDIPNAITLYGRNNTSVAFLNLGGTNSLSGTITAQSGGSKYIIQSDAGTLRLTAASAGTATAGVSLRAGSTATGSRTFTFQGAGDGTVSGRIENGTATATVGVAKAGTGTWSLDGDNNYTGPTAVTGGALLVNGTHSGGGAYTVAAGATLGGAGTIDPAGTNAVTVSGRLAPGNNTVGTLTVGSAGSANNIVFDGGSLQVELAPANLVGTKYTQQFDRLAVAGRAQLAGTLEIVLLDGFLPAAGSGFRVLTAGTVSARFDRLAGALLGPGADANHVRYANPAYDATGVTLAVTERLLGDADLDGRVGFSDLLTVAQNYDLAPTTADPWLAGDFDADGAVGFADLLAVAQRYDLADPAAAPLGLTPGAALTAEQGQALVDAVLAVPEPATGAALAGALLGLAARRPRRRSPAGAA